MDQFDDIQPTWSRGAGLFVSPSLLDIEVDSVLVFLSGTI